MVRLAIMDAAKEDEPEVAKGIYPSKNLTTQTMEDDPHGLIFGKNVYDKKYLIKPENVDGHRITIGGSGSGKSSCANIPTLIKWRGNFIAFDLKGELVEKTAWARSAYKVFNPTDPEAAGIDFFYLLDKKPNKKIQAVRDIVLALIPTPISQEPVWAEGAQNLLTAAILHFHSLGYDFAQTMKEIRSLPLNELLIAIQSGDCEEAKIYNSQFLDPDGRRMVTSYYSLMCNAITVFATDKELRSSFNREIMISPADLVRGCDIYISIPENMLKQWAPALRLIVAQFMSALETREDNNKSDANILFSIDEMPRFGKIEAITGLSTLRSKGVTFDIYVQSLAQLDEIYGIATRRTILDNCDFQFIMRISEPDTQEYFSRAIGNYDKEEMSESENIEGFWGSSANDKMKRRITKSKRETRIIKPDEFRELSVPVILSTYGFMRTFKTPYYKTKEFIDSEIWETMKPKEPEEKSFFEKYTPYTVAQFAFMVYYLLEMISSITQR